MRKTQCGLLSCWSSQRLRYRRRKATPVADIWALIVGTSLMTIDGLLTALVASTRS